MAKNLSDASGIIEETKRLCELGKQNEAMRILRQFRQRFSHDDTDGYTKELIEREIVMVSCERIKKLHAEGKFRESYSASLKDLECIQDDFHEEGKLSLKNNAALSLVENGETYRSYKLYTEIIPRYLQLFGPDHENTLTAQSSLAFVLGHLGKIEDSLKLYKDTLERMGRIGDHPYFLTTLMNMAVTMMESGASEDALEHFEIGLEQTMRVSGPDHPDTLVIQNNSAKALLQLRRFPEALEVFTYVFEKRMEKLGPNNLATMDSLFYAGRVVCEQGKYLEALRTFDLVLAKYKTSQGDSHPDTLRISQVIEMLKRRVGPEEFTELQTMCIKLDTLHNFISCGDKYGVYVLLRDGSVDITQKIPVKGYTPLHMAVHRNNFDIVENLLKYAKKKLTPSEFVKFIDAKTTSAVGNTAMHIAASNGSLIPMKALLRYGATYNIQNKRGKTPVELTNEPKIKSLLGLVDEMFVAAKRGDPGVISKLKALDKSERLSIINARDDRGYSLHQVSKTKSLSAEFSKLSI